MVGGVEPVELTTGPSQLEQAPDQRLVLKLFVVGGRPESALAVSRLRTILREHGFADSSLQIFDIEQRPEIAREAQVVGVPLGTVKSRLFRARRALQQRLYDYALEMGYIRRKRT